MKKYSCIECTDEILYNVYNKNQDELECKLKCDKCDEVYMHPEYLNMHINCLDLADSNGIIYTKEHGDWFPLEHKTNRREEHQKYLRTSKWKEIRKKVLKRDDYTCQGCLENRATEVHHITYDNWKNEFMFELMSLCRECHSRFHKKDKQ
jgi:hypothetical protein